MQDRYASHCALSLRMPLCITLSTFPVLSLRMHLCISLCTCPTHASSHVTVYFSCAYLYVSLRMPLCISLPYSPFACIYALHSVLALRISLCTFPTHVSMPFPVYFPYAVGCAEHNVFTRRRYLKNFYLKTFAPNKLSFTLCQLPPSWLGNHQRNTSKMCALES